MAEIVYPLLVLLLVAAAAAAGWETYRARRDRDRAVEQLQRHRAALTALGDLALDRGVPVPEIRAAVRRAGLEVEDQRPDATVVMSAIDKPRKPSPRPKRRPDHNGANGATYAPGRAAPQSREEPR